ncbi:hypothetical protein J6590_027254 [Homalodisca vitripennis]|nr:hypothetical protein J6590_027254 [Homalodisca vitripennis]
MHRGGLLTFTHRTFSDSLLIASLRPPGPAIVLLYVYQCGSVTGISSSPTLQS